ncbi:MAG: hypothetical protein LBI45_08220 [Bacteroidales bacterium]|jgi:hypothetical protein|nr:hypothetical protein [Bacteroidales bacterium]
MKKTLIFLAITVITIQVNAQWFIGGDVCVNVTNSDENFVWGNVNKTEAGFQIAPKFGHYFNNKFALGLSVSFGANFSINNAGNSTKNQEYSLHWGFIPFLRYSVFTYKKFSIILQGSTGVRGTHYFSQTGSNSVKGGSALGIRVIGVSPILGFNLTDHLQMEAGLNFLDLGYNIDIITNTNSDIIKHVFNIGFKSSSILSLSQLQFGVIYKF